MFLFDFLSEKADLGAAIPHVVAVNVLAVVELTDLLFIMFKLLVREKPGRLLGCGGGPGQRTSTHRNVRKELRDLERIPLLLQELIINRRVLRLLGLLLQSTRPQLRLST